MSDIPADFKFGACFVNYDEHAYLKARFDQKSIDWFVDNLGSLSSAVTRGAIWRHFWILVKDKKMTSLKYIEFLKKQLPLETVDQIIAVGLMNIRTLIPSYIPPELVK